MGTIAYKEQQLDKAEKLLRQAISFNPHQIEFYENLGLVYFIKKQYLQAASTFQAGLARMPHALTLLKHLGRTYQLLNQPTKAQAIHQKILQFAPDNKFAQNGLIDTATQQAITAYVPATEQALLRCLHFENANLDALSSSIASTLLHKYPSGPQPQQLAQDKLLLCALEKIICSHFEFEKMLTRLRCQLLLACSKDLRVDPKYIALMHAIALQSFNNEYV